MNHDAQFLLGCIKYFTLLVHKTVSKLDVAIALMHLPQDGCPVSLKLCVSQNTSHFSPFVDISMSKFLS